MCFGNFYSKGELCSTCKVVRSCKRESLRRINSEKKKHDMQRIKNNTISRYGSKAKKILLIYLYQHKKPISTYLLTKTFKKHHSLNISDTKVLELCYELKAEGHIELIQTKKGRYSCRYWYLKNNKA